MGIIQKYRLMIDLKERLLHIYDLERFNPQTNERLDQFLHDAIDEIVEAETNLSI